MDLELLKIFNKKINDKGLILHIYRNKSEKNKWSIICSAMDWIEVSLEGIDTSKLSRGNNNQASIRMITFISCISNLWEAIQQLHRVFFNTDKIPMKDDFSVFNKHISDNDYFMTIRACFAAHPINLKQVFPDDEDNERWFASWSGGTFSAGDFSVVLYSNNPEKEPRFFDINFNELYEFAKKRYQYLNVIMEKIDLIINDYMNSFRNILIDDKFNNLDNINNLIEENKKRFDNDYYDYELKKMKIVFETKLSPYEENIVTTSLYKSVLRDELNEIKNKLQNMELEDLEHQIDVDIPNKILYVFSKLSDSVWSNTMCNRFELTIETINEFFNGIITLDYTMSQQEVYVLTLSGLYMVNKIKKEIYKEKL